MAENDALPRKKTRRIRRVLFIFLVFLILLIAFGPAIVAHTFLRNTIARAALSEIDGDIHIESASIGWFASPTLENVTITDKEGKTIVKLPKVVGSKSLWSFLWNRTDLGSFRIEKPQIEVVCNKAGTNLEEVFACFLKPSATQSESPQVKLEIVDGEIHVREASTGRDWTLSAVNSELSIPSESSEAMVLELKSKIAEGKNPAASDLHVKATLAPENLALNVSATKLPLSLAQAVGRRFDDSLRTSGSLSCTLDGEWKGNQGKVKGKLEGEDIYLAASWLGTDRLRLSKVTLPCQATVTGKTLHLTQAELTCDLGKASLQGELDLSKDLITLLKQPGYHANANLDVALLAKLLPHTLRLQRDTEITSGRITFDVTSSKREHGTAWKGKLTTTDLKGKRDGRALAWKEPLSLDLAAHQEGGGLPVVDRLDCRSSFLTVTGSGSTEKMTLTAKYDLDRLLAEMSQFVDLDGTKLSGSGVTLLTLQREGEKDFHIKADSTLHDLEVTLPKTKPYRERQVLVTLDGKCKNSEGKIQLISGRCEAIFGADRAEIKLIKPINDLFSAQVDETEIHVQGELQRWRQRLKPFIAGIDSLDLHGSADLSGILKLKGDQLTLSKATLKATAASLKLGDLHLKEPEVKLASSIALDQKTGKLTLSDLQVTCPSLTARSSQLDYHFSSKAMVPMSGSVILEGDLARIHGWLPKTVTPMVGQVKATVKLEPKGKQSHLEIEGGAQNLVIGSRKNPDWREPNLTLRGSADLSADQMQIQNLVVNGKLVSLTSKGTLSSKQKLSLTGKLDYDLEAVLKDLAPNIQKTVKLTSPRATRPFKFEGSLAEGVQHWIAETEVSWNGLQALGCQAGPATTRARLEKGWLSFSTIQCAWNQGRLSVTPQLRLTSGPLELHIQKGTVLQRAKLTPEMCNDAIKYVVPALAGVTEGRGEVSLSLQECQIPLADFSKGKLRGGLKVHSADVRGNPLVQELSQLLLQKPASVSLRRESEVSFRMQNGWVEHRGVEIEFPGLLVKTYGAVHVSGQVSMIAEFPVPKKWLGNGELTKALSTKVIRIPISGTLARPRLDQEAMQREARRVLQEATTNVIRDTIDSQLRKLFDRKK